MQSAIRAEAARLAIDLERRFRASPERVFRAWTQPAALREWWCPAGWIASEIEVDLRVGGSYCTAMSRGDGSGSYKARGGCVPRTPSRCAATPAWRPSSSRHH